MLIDSKSLDEEQAHVLLKSCVVPRPVAWVSTRSRAGIANLAPYSCFTFVATKPPMISLSIGRKTDGSMKDTLTNILETGEFIVHIVPHTYAEHLTATAAEISSDQSEWDLTPYKPVKAHRVQASRIESAPIAMECRLHQSIPLGESLHTLVVGEVMLFDIQDDLYRKDKVDVAALQPVSRLSDDQFAKLGEIFEVTRRQA